MELNVLKVELVSEELADLSGVEVTLNMPPLPHMSYTVEVDAKKVQKVANLVKSSGSAAN